MTKEKIITSSYSLNEFFYKNLSFKNKQISCPLPEEFIFYSSLVLERYALSDVFFDSNDSGINQKIFGMRYLDSLGKDKDEKIVELKDVGDTILVQLGLFSDSVNKKITNKGYYISLAQSAYAQLDSMNSNFYDIPNFYKLFASSFEKTIILLEVMSGELLTPNKTHPLLIQPSIANKKAV